MAAIQPKHLDSSAMDPILLVRCDAGETFGVAPSALEHAGAPITVWEAVDGEPRPSLHGIGGVVLFGSSYNVEHADEQRFIADTRALTIEAVERQDSLTSASASARRCSPGRSTLPW